MSTESVTLEAALARLAAAIAQIEEAARAPQPAPASLTEPAPVAAGRADGMMDALRADLAARYFGAPATASAPLQPFDQPPPSLQPMVWPDTSPLPLGFAGDASPAPVIERKDAYGIDELMGRHDEAFLRNAFLALLRREPDPVGFEHYRWSLLDGRLTRRDVLCELHHSPEGRKANVKVHGMRRVDALRRVTRVPIVGRIVAIAIGAWRLPSFARRLERQESQVLSFQWQAARQVHGLAVAAEGAVRAIDIRRTEGLAQVSEALSRLDAGQRELAGFAAALAERTRELIQLATAHRKWAGTFGEALAGMDRAVHAVRDQAAHGITREDMLRALQPVNEALAAMVGVSAQVDAQRGEMAFLEAAVKQALLQAGPARAPAEAEDVPELDTFYRDFENRFRGTREDIMSRVEPYVADVAPVVAATRGPVLDIGCGRGEWLELLGERGVEARGVDSNAAMVRDAQSRGLRVDEGEALAWLRLLPAESLGAITGFHVVEHLEFPVLVALFDQAFRVLKPGGLLIFETPNPENIVVGAFTFWYDPTHQRPLPPDMLRFVAEARGFQRVDIRRLHPNPEWERLPAGELDPALRERLDALLYGPRDYAILAYKP